MSSHAHKIYQFDPADGTEGSGKISILVALMLALAFVLVTRPSIHGNDGVQNYSYLRSLMFDGNLDFTNEYDYFISKEADWFDKKQIPRDPVTDLPINLYGVGSSILWAPWIAAVHGLGVTAKKFGAEIELNGYSQLYAWGVGYGSCFYATLGLWLLFRLLKEFGGELSASWALLLIWLASPLFFYMYIHPSMSHANSFFLAVLMLVQYLAHPQQAWRWGLLGLTCGLLVITRFQDGILFVAMLAGELWNWNQAEGSKWHWLRRQIPLYTAWFAGFVIMLIPQILAWGYLQGSYFSGPRAYIHQGNFSFLAPAYAPQVLFSSNHGVFYWHPALLIAFGGLLFSGPLMREKLMGLSAFAAQVWVVASWSIWWAGASFGHRMFISALPFLAIGALFTVGRPGKAGVILKLVLIPLIVWNFGCIIQYGLGWIPRQKEVSYVELGYNNFVRLPMMVLEQIIN